MKFLLYKREDLWSHFLIRLTYHILCDAAHTSWTVTHSMTWFMPETPYPPSTASLMKPDSPQVVSQEFWMSQYSYSTSSVVVAPSDTSSFSQQYFLLYRRAVSLSHFLAAFSVLVTLAQDHLYLSLVVTVLVTVSVPSPTITTAWSIHLGHLLVESRIPDS